MQIRLTLRQPRCRPSAGLLLCLLTPGLAHADEGGTYCIAQGYIACEVCEASSAAGHALRLARFAPAEGAPEVLAVPLGEFQLHGMQCQPQKIIL